MSARTDRRRFLQTAAAGGALARPRRPGLPVAAPAGLGRRGEARPEGRPPRSPRSSRSSACSRRRRASGCSRRSPARIQQGHELPRGARRAAAGRRAERPAAALRRLQVPRGAGRQLGPPGQPRLARHRPLAADLLGARLLQELAGAGRPRGQLDDGAGRRVGRPARPQGPRGVRRRRWTAGTRRPPTRRSPAWPASAGANAIYELFFRYGARDFRSIGHKAIYVANSCRTLQCIGWQHAEPVLRSLAYALLMHEGGNPADRDAPADRPWRRNQELARPGSRRAGRGASRTTAASADLLATLRARAPTRTPASRSSSCSTAGVAPQSIWDALLRRRRRAADAPAGDRRAARGDHDQRPALSPTRPAATTRPAGCCCSRTRRSCRCSATRWAAGARSAKRGSTGSNRSPRRRTARGPSRRSSPR